MTSSLGDDESLAGFRFSREEVLGAATLTAGYFAGRAHQPPLKELPRLRWIQKQQLIPALRWMARMMEPGAEELFEERPTELLI